MRANPTMEFAEPRVGVRPVERAHRLPLVPFGLALSSFLVVSYVLCIIGYLILPGFAPQSHAALSVFLPGFELLSWQSFCLGLVESFAWGWYVALIFAPLYNLFVTRWQ